MTCAPATGCKRSRFASIASAGGHDEHPSEVNNSTRTGTALPARGAACGFGLSAATANDAPNNTLADSIGKNETLIATSQPIGCSKYGLDTAYVARTFLSAQAAHLLPARGQECPRHTGLSLHKLISEQAYFSTKPANIFCGSTAISVARPRASTSPC